jgi:hypothetical protein
LPAHHATKQVLLIVFEGRLRESIGAAFTVHGRCLLHDVGGFPYFKAAHCRFLTWLQYALGQLHRLLWLLQHCDDDSNCWAVRWHALFRGEDVDAAELLVAQLQNLLLHIPGLVVDRLLPTMDFVQQMECLCRMAFLGCVPLMRHPRAYRPRRGSSYTHAYFMGVWRAPLYRALAPSDGFEWQLLLAYDRPVAQLQDHYRFYKLVCSMSK